MARLTFLDVPGSGAAELYRAAVEIVGPEDCRLSASALTEPGWTTVAVSRDPFERLLAIKPPGLPLEDYCRAILVEPVSVSPVLAQAAEVIPDKSAAAIVSDWIGRCVTLDFVPAAESFSLPHREWLGPTLAEDIAFHIAVLAKWRRRQAA